jgi:hypothetical protein
MDDPIDFYYQIMEGILDKSDGSNHIPRIDQMNYYRAKKGIYLLQAERTLSPKARTWYRTEGEFCDKRVEGLEFRVDTPREPRAPRAVA